MRAVDPVSAKPSPTRELEPSPKLVRRLGLFHATMIVIGGIVGAGIFRNPHVVAKQLHSPAWMLSAWVVGGLIALAGAFIYAELTASRPAVGGQYAFFREAYHPALAFLYGWALLMVSQTGGMAAVSITFADYSLKLLKLSGMDSAVGMLEQAGSFLGAGGGSKLLAIFSLAALTVINCLGVRAGAAVQSTLTVLKMAAIAGLVACGFMLPLATGASVNTAVAADSLPQFGAAMVSVLFAYGGWQTACFIAGEVKNPHRNLPLGLMFGVLGVIVLYLSVNWVCLRALGPTELAQTITPAADLVERALGNRGAFFISAGILISTLGFLSQGMLTAPRVYFAMAEDGLFFKALARVHPTTGAPVAAIVLQGCMAILIALSGQYDAILNYVVSVDFIFFGLTATCIFVFRRRDANRGAGSQAIGRFRIPGHPFTTLFFIASCWLVVANSVYAQPKESLIGFAILALGIPVYCFWRQSKPAT